MSADEVAAWREAIYDLALMVGFLVAATCGLLSVKAVA